MACELTELSFAEVRAGPSWRGDCGGEEAGEHMEVLIKIDKIGLGDDREAEIFLVSVSNELG